jgi:hypothetical protein
MKNEVEMTRKKTILTNSRCYAPFCLEEMENNICMVAGLLAEFLIQNILNTEQE